MGYRAKKRGDTIQSVRKRIMTRTFIVITSPRVPRQPTTAELHADPHLFFKSYLHVELRIFKLHSVVSIWKPYQKAVFSWASTKGPECRVPDSSIESPRLQRFWGNYNYLQLLQLNVVLKGISRRWIRRAHQKIWNIILQILVYCILVYFSCLPPRI